MSFSEQQEGSLQLLKTTGATLSIIGATIVVVSYFLSKRIRTSSPSAIFTGMSVADFISAICMVSGQASIASGASSASCQTQAFFLQNALLASVLYSVSMAVSMILILIFQMTSERIRSIQTYIHVGIWSLTSILATVPFMFGTAYGNADLWCWVTSSYAQLQLGLLYVPVWGAFLFVNATAYYAVWNYLNMQTKSSSNAHSTGRLKAMKKSYVRTVVVYTVAFVVTWLPGTINRLTIMISGNKIFVLACLQAFFLPLGGFMNFAACFLSTLYRYNAQNAGTNGTSTRASRKRRDQGGSRQSKHSEHSIHSVSTVPAVPPLPMDEEDSVKSLEISDDEIQQKPPVVPKQTVQSQMYSYNFDSIRSDKDYDSFDSVDEPQIPRPLEISNTERMSQRNNYQSPLQENKESFLYSAHKSTSKKGLIAQAKRKSRFHDCNF